uniref:Uncharacterized protein n=1 Tax=Faecalibaculum rodentium TaxID=1702221 RepID=A0A140DRC7_9FIRM|nr:hypothetical protein AALO17_00700 [Faecalibaculum rodentium]
MRKQVDGSTHQRKESSLSLCIYRSFGGGSIQMTEKSVTFPWRETDALCRQMPRPESPETGSV